MDGLKTPPVPHGAAFEDFWESLYRERDTPWDLGTPTPVFVRLAREGVLAPPASVLVPGAGRGYDAIALARAGFAVTAVDMAASACEAMRQAAAHAGVDLTVQQANFFDLPAVLAYDLVLEYTFYCAIPPELRAAYHRQMAALIRPGGRLVGLFFPLDPLDEEGPPFQVRPEAVKEALGAAFDLELEARPEDSIKPRRGREVLMVWRRKPG